MKILYITTKADYGGVQTHIIQCASYMLQKGNEVMVMAHPGGRDGLFEREIKKIGINFFPNIFLRNSFNPLWGLLAIIKIQKTVKDFKPDIVSLHSSAAGFWGRLAIRNKVPTIFTAHGWGFTEGVSKVKAMIIRSAEKIVASFCKKIICVSDNDAQLAKKYKIIDLKDLLVIHNGTDLSLKNKLPNLQIFSSREGIIPVVVNGSRLSHPKKPEQVLEVFSKLPDYLKEKAEMFIIGEGEKRILLEKNIKNSNLEERVHLLGALPLGEYLSFLKYLREKYSSRIFVLISEYEGFPRGILEAMDFGFAIIASDVGGIREVVTKDVGFLIKRNDLVELDRVLRVFLENPMQITEFGFNAEERIRNNFPLEKMLQATLKVYESVLL